MTKAELVSKIAQKTGVEKLTTLAIVESMMNEIKESISANEAVFLRGFGTFKPKKRAEKTGRNIKKNTTMALFLWFYKFQTFQAHRCCKQAIIDNRFSFFNFVYSPNGSTIVHTDIFANFKSMFRFWGCLGGFGFGRFFLFSDFGDLLFYFFLESIFLLELGSFLFVGKLFFFGIFDLNQLKQFRHKFPFAFVLLEFIA